MTNLCTDQPHFLRQHLHAFKCRLTNQFTGQLQNQATHLRASQTVQLLTKSKAAMQLLYTTLAAPNEVHYINSNQTLPPPLTAEEEKRVFALLEQGSEEAKNELITHNLRLVVYIAKKFESSGVSVEDIISIGTIGLIKAVNTFSPSKNIKLATYASRCIENEILMYLRKASNRRQEASIDEPLNIDGDGNELLLSDILGSDANLVSQRLEKEAEHSVLHRAVARLNPRERQIMEMRFGLAGKKEKTQKEVAEEIGISQSYISRLEKRIIKTLRRQLEQEESS